MFSTFGRSWEMLKQSYAVLKKQKTLLVLPVLSGLACLVVLASFALPFIVNPELAEKFFADAKQAKQQGDSSLQIVGFVFAFLFYFVNYFIIVFFNTALASCAIVHFKGGEPTLGDGLAAASRRLPQILAWAFVAATVGMILKAIEDKAGRLGTFIVGLLGLAWSAAVYLVVPVLAVEGLGPVAAVKRSIGLLRKTWGEGLAGGLGLGLAGFLLSLPGIVLIVVGGMLGATSVPLMVAIIALGFIYLVGISIVLSTLKQIFISGLYLYAAEGQLPSGFSEDIVSEAFRKK